MIAFARLVCSSVSVSYFKFKMGYCRSNEPMLEICKLGMPDHEFTLYMTIVVSAPNMCDKAHRRATHATG